MRTEVLFSVRCKPTVTEKKLAAINGTGTAFITELIRNKKGQQIVSIKDYKRVSNFEQLKEAAEDGKDVIYKTASLWGSSKFYVKK